MNDSDRLDAIGEYGLCVATHDSLTREGWERTWVCQYEIAGETRVIFAPDIRDVIDAAILEFTTINGPRH